MSIVYIFLVIDIFAANVPDSPDHIGFNDSKDDQSENFETIHENILCNNPILSLRTFEDLLEQPVHLALVQ